jgi:cytochrome c5
MKKLLLILAVAVTVVACDDSKTPSETPATDTAAAAPATVDTAAPAAVDTTKAAVVDTTKK